VCSSDLRVDFGAWQGLRSTLNRWTLAGYVNERVSPAELARRAILPILPMQVIMGEQGLAPMLWPWLDALASAPARTLTEGPGVVRAGRVTYSDVDPVAEVVLRYGPDTEAGDYTEAVVVSAASTPYGMAGASIFGDLAKGSEIEASWVWDAGTAQALAAAQLVSRCVPRRRIRYALDPDRYGIGGVMELRPGMVVRMTDADVGVSSALALVAEIEQTPVEMTAVIDLRDDILEA
jgi:hypothetical protein